MGAIIVGAVEGARGWLLTIARAAEIAAIALVCVLAYTAGALRRLVMRDKHERAAHRAHSRGRLLRWSFARLGASFIKIGQIMSSRPDLFSAGVITELRWLQDRVPPFPFAQVREIIERELGAPMSMRFREFDQDSVAAGSVAQVHHAVLRNGDEVAVKVLRPNVLERVRRDGRILLWLAHIAHAVSSRARSAMVVGHTRDLVAGILAQTDLRREMNNYEKFRRDFEGTPGLGFPRVYRRHTTRWMLTMEFIHGTRVDACPPEHLAEAARVIRSMFLTMCFEHGFIHADLHPGNVLIREGGGVVILDVGLVKRLSRKLTVQVVDFARCLAIGSSADLVAHLRRYHRYLATTDWSAVATDAQAFMAGVRAKPLKELELAAVIAELFALARKHQIRPLPDMTLILLGMVTSEGMAKRLDPNVDMVAELARHLGSIPAPEPRVAKLARGSRRFPRPTGLPPMPEPAAPELAPAAPSTVVVCRAPRARPRRTERQAAGIVEGDRPTKPSSSRRL